MSAKESKEFFVEQGFTLRSVCKELGLELPASLEAQADEPLTAIASSSMTARPGCLYVCRGSSEKIRADARRAWEEKGVRAFLTPRAMTDAHGTELPSIICKTPTPSVLQLMSTVRSRTHARVLALTGSVGKTSTKEMIRLVAQETLAVEWSGSNQNGFSQVLASLQRLNPATDLLVQEVGMGKPGTVERAGKVLRPDYFVLTNIGINHIEYYGGKQENILAEKLNLDRQAAPGAVGFVNWDDPLLRGATYTHDIVTFGIENADARYSAANVEERNGQVLFDVVEQGVDEPMHVVLNIVGRHNVYNALAAYAVGRELGVPVERITAALARFHATGVRQNLTWIAGHHVYLDCYNASEVAIESAASTLETIDIPAGGKRIFVVGDIDDKLGDITEEVHRRVGRTLATHEGIHLLIFFGDHMRWAADEAQDAGKLVLATSDRAQLEEYIARNLEPEDLLGFKGGQQMRLALTLDNLFGTNFFLLDGDMVAKVARPSVEIDGMRYRVLDGYGTELIRFRGLRFTRVGKNPLARAFRSKVSGFTLAPVAAVDGMPLRVIAARAFRESKLRGVVLPEGLQAIGYEAFADCTYLKSVELPRSLRYIAPRAFAGCTALERIVIPEGVLTIDAGTFAGCSALSEVALPASCKTVADDAFTGCPAAQKLARR